MSILIVSNKVKIFENQSGESILKVRIQPCNENQELNYIETFEGTVRDILLHSKEILEGLKKLLSKGDFSIKIEDLECTQVRFVDKENLYDENFDKIIALNQILK